MQKRRKGGARSGRIRVGVAGLGRSGWGIHVRLLRELQGKYRVAAVFDKDPARRREAYLNARFNGSTRKLKSMVRPETFRLISVFMRVSSRR